MTDLQFTDRPNDKMTSSTICKKLPEQKVTSSVMVQAYLEIFNTLVDELNVVDSLERLCTHMSSEKKTPVKTRALIVNGGPSITLPKFLWSSASKFDNITPESAEVVGK